MIRAAIIGTGSIAGEHARILRAASGQVELVAAADVDGPRLDAFCSAYAIPSRYAAIEELLEAERPELVHICTPPAVHAQQAVAALQAGAWVFCEKPLCASLAELDRIEAAEIETGCFCVSVAQWRFGSAAQHLKSLAERGIAGRPLLGLCQTTWYRGADYFAVPWRGQWQAAVGGATMAQGIHAIDLFLWIMGDWSEVTASVATLDHDIEVEDASLATIDFEGRALGSVVNSVVSPHEETRLRFDFQRATFEVACLYAYRNSDWRCMPIPGADDVAAAWAAIERDVPNTHEAQLATVLAAFEARQKPPATAADLRPTFDLISSLYKSAALGMPVRRGSIRPGDPFYDHVAGTLAKSR